jgi:carbamoylphosphate synthase large subunit
MTIKFKDIQTEIHFKLQTIKNSEDREEFTKKFKEIEKESDKNDKEFITKCKQLIYEIDHEISKKTII